MAITTTYQTMVFPWFSPFSYAFPRLQRSSSPRFRAMPQEIRNQAMAEGDAERQRLRAAKTQDCRCENPGEFMVFMGFYGDLLGSNGISWVFVVTFWDLMGFHSFYGDFLGSNGISWVLMVAYWDPMGFHGFWWWLSGISWDSMGFYGGLLGSNGVSWVFMVTYWDPMGFYGFWWWLTGIQWDFMGFMVTF